jgi:Rrf2 family cysteine metabolism transcriptional repressor
MKLSARSRYGLRALFELAMNYQNGPMPIRTMALRAQISNKYLEQLISILKTGGLVLSRRGPKGGYVLARLPEDTRLNDVLTMLEGQTTLPDCTVHKDYCATCGDCLMHTLWLKMAREIDSVFSSVSLKDMADGKVKPE